MTTLVALAVIGAATTAMAVNVAYSDPSGGWGYAYLGDSAAYVGNTNTIGALDGSWTRSPNDDVWDGTAIGTSPAPGGVNTVTEGSMDYLRMQDTGNPRDYAFPSADPSNRKIGFSRDISSLTPATPLNTGVTLSFRARIPTTGTLDDLYPAGGGGTAAYPAAGDGYLTHDDGKGGFSIHQPDPTLASVGNIISFSLTTPFDDNGASGLMMPNLNGTQATVSVDYGEAGTPNFLPIADTTAWHEFWICIQAGGTGTHQVSIYMDGSLTPTVFDVTAGTGNPSSPSARIIGMDVGATPQSGALDVDFFAVKNGCIAPTAVPEPTAMGLSVLGLVAMALVARRQRDKRR